MKCDEKLVRLEETYGDWVKKDQENCRLSSGAMTKKLYPYKALFSPIQVNKTMIKNRVVMGPMGNLNMCEESGRPNDKMLQYFFARAKGGTGLLTTGLIPVSHGIDPTVTEVDDLSLFPRIDHARTVFAGWRDLAQGVHAYGSKIFIQITPGLGRVGPPTCVMTKHKIPVSASVNPSFYIPQLPCIPLTDANLKKIVKNCGQAAADAREMGLDGIYLHGHEGYLLEQMTNPAFNRRQMGRYKDYELFGLDIIREIRKRAGDTFPIMYRIDLSLALNETYQERMDEVSSLKKFKNGRTIKDTLHYMAKLVRAGVDLFDVDLGCYDNWWLPHPPEGMPVGCFLDISKIAKEFFRRNNIKSNVGVDVPVVAVGKLGYPDIAEQAIRDGDCDMVMLARPLLADPDWCNKAFAGNVEEIRPCIGCQEGCVNEFILGGHPQCAVNPRTGFEERFPETFTPAEKPKKIAVVGGGPAGITFALIAAKRGHEVTLYEKSEKLGGKIAAGSIPKIKFDLRNYLAYLEKQVELCQKEHQLQVYTNTTVTTEFLKEKAYDSVIFAYGTKEIFPPFEGREEANLILGTELLEHPEKAENAKNIVIVGGGVVGCETAHWLANEYGKNVIVLEMLPHFMVGVCTANRGHLLHYLEKSGVRLFNCTKVKALAKDGVYVEQNQSSTVPDPYNTWQPLLPPNIPNPMEKAIKEEIVEKKIPADLIVLAMGGKADETFFFEAGEEHLAKEIYNIGDSSRAGRVLEAVRGAYHLAVRI